MTFPLIGIFRIFKEYSNAKCNTNPATMQKKGIEGSNLYYSLIPLLFTKSQLVFFYAIFSI